MFREIRTTEKFTEEDNRNKAYLNIKPERTMTIEEMNNMINLIWSEEISKANIEG